MSLEFEPTADQVAELIRARTKNANGVETGIFTATTRPTLTQMNEVLAAGAGDLGLVIGHNIPDVLIPEAQHVAAIRAAMLTELGYFPEQVRSGRSPYPELKEMYDIKVESLRLAVIGAADGTVDVQPTPPAGADGGVPWPVGQGGAYFWFDDHELVGTRNW